MVVKKLPYREGDWFAVPLRDGGYALGRIARADGKGIVVGYFFGPRQERVPTIREAEGKRPDDAILVKLFGDLGLLQGRWPVLGHRPPWRREEWPIPAFQRIDEIANKAWRVRYDDSSLIAAAEERVAPDEVRSLPRDGTSGAGAIETRLARILPA